MHSHDLIVIGAGMAGINATVRAAEDGRRVALVERGMIGGTCPTRGCIPTKALVRSAEIAHEVRRAGEFGIRVGEVEVDFAAVMDRVREIIARGSRGTRTYWLGSRGNKWPIWCRAAARNRRSDGMPMIAWATQRVTTSASLSSRRAFAGLSGRRSSVVQ